MGPLLLGLLLLAFGILFTMNLPFILLPFYPEPNYMHSYNEPFLNTQDSSQEEAECGVDLPDCPENMKCMNGYCKSTTPPVLPKKSDLPVYP